MAMTGTPAVVDGQPAKGGTLRVAYGTDPGESNIVLQTWSSTTLPYTSMYNRLITRAPDWTFMPQLAYDWDIENDGRKFTFYLEENVKFHDGTPMTAADVIHTYYAIYGYQSTNGKGMRTSGLISITAPDDYTVVFEFERICQTNTFGEYGGDIFIKPEHLYKADGIDWDTLHVWTEEERVAYEDWSHAQDNEDIGGGPVGTGPFKYVEHELGAYLLFERFDDYWETGLPYLDELQIIIIRDANTALLALLNGEVDAYHGARPGFPLSQKDLVNAMEDFTVETMSSTGTYHITFNMNPDSSPTDPLSAKPGEQWVLNTDVRIAMEYAIDKEAIVHSVFYDVVPPQYTTIPEHIWAYNDALEHRVYDVAKAEQLLDDAGYTVQADGWRLHKVVFKTYATLADCGEAVEAYLRDVGIEAISTPIDNTVFYDTYELGLGVGGPVWSAMDENEEAFAINSMGSYSAASIFPWIYTWDETNQGYENFGHYSDARVDELLQFAVYETADPAKQGPAFDEIQEIIWTQNPFIFIMPSWKCEAWNNRFSGFNPGNRPIPIFGSYKGVYDKEAGMTTSGPGTVTVTGMTTIVSTVNELALVAVPFSLVTIAVFGKAIRRHLKRR
jgi:peptide/nickel transport system substrate-binding protein